MGEVVQFGRGGPRTAAGKRRSSLNALKSGLHAKTVVIRGVESEDEFNALVRDLLAFHNSESDPIVTLALERFASVAWRLRRVRRVESEKLSQRARAYVDASASLQALRDELERLIAWGEATATVMYGTGTVAADVIERFREGVQYLFETTELERHGISTCPEFDCEKLMRIDARGKPVQRRTLNAAIEQARCTLPPGLAGPDLRDFLWSVRHAFDERQKQHRRLIETHERDAIEAQIGAMRLDWQDERSLSDAERRLDAQFTRALHDFHAARAAAEDAGDPRLKRRGAAAANQ